MNDPIVSIRALNKSFQSKKEVVEVIKDFNLDVHAGEFLSIFGPNGCGKTTLLNIIANIDQPTTGEVVISDKDSDSNQVGIVFQNYDKSLMPWKRCIENIYFPLERDNHLSKQEKVKKAKNMLEILGLERLPLNSFPYEMSGGEKQLTCIARAMITNPKILLFDEAFASLDFQTRLDMVQIVENIWEKTKKTFIFISHEIGEAIQLADRLALLTPRPTSVKMVYSIHFPRPRKENNSDFILLKTSILNEFSKMIKK